jgi:hypothetical protein
MAKKKKPSGSRSRPPQKDNGQPIGPLPLVKQRLQRVPLSGEVWQADFRQPPPSPGATDAPRPWIFLIGSEATSLIRGADVMGDIPTTEVLWDRIAVAIQEPMAGTPGRPSLLRVGFLPQWETLRPHLIEIGIDLETEAELGLMDMVFEDMFRTITGPAVDTTATPILKVKGMTVEKAASFFEASALFYKEKPWKRLDEEAAIEIVCPELTGGPWYAVIMGVMGVTSGLALYTDLDWLERVWTEELSPEEQTEGTEAIAVTYGPSDTILPEDLAAMKEHGWKPGGRDGYPEIYRKERGRNMRTPSAPDFAVLDACLRALPTFVKRREPSDDTPEQVAVDSPSGRLMVTLRWMADI